MMCIHPKPINTKRNFKNRPKNEAWGGKNVLGAFFGNSEVIFGHKGVKIGENVYCNSEVIFGHKGLKIGENVYFI